MAEQQNEALDLILAHVADKMARGLGPREIQAELQARGLAADIAEELVAGMFAARRKRRRRAGLKGMAAGGLICLVGLFITAGTYGAASQNGGSYVVAYGAMISGGAIFLAGLIRTVTGL